MPRVTSRHLALALKVAVAISLTGLFLHYASPAQILRALRSANPWLVSTIIPLTLVCMALAALQLKILTDCHGMKVGLAQIVHINSSTEFYSLFLPGIIAGGALRWYRLSRDNQMRAQALVAITANRALNVVALLAVGIAGWLLGDEPPGTAVFCWFLVACAVAIAVLAFVLRRPQFASSLRARPGGRRLLPSRLHAGWLKMMDALREYRRIPPLARARMMVYAVGWQLANVLGTYLLCLALDMDVGMGTIAWIRAMLSLALMIPITVGGFGIREGGWIYFLAFYGVAPADAFALSLLTFVRTLFQAMIGLALEIRTLFRLAARG